METNLIKKEVLSSYIDRSNVSVDFIESKMKDIRLFLDGQKSPTFNQIREIAKIINVPTGLLVLPDAIDTNSRRLEFRTVGSSEVYDMSQELMDTIREMEFKQEFLREEIDNELDFVGRFNISTNHKYLARTIRDMLGVDFSAHRRELSNNSFAFYRERVNNIGVFVFLNGKVKDNTRRPLDLHEFRGFVLSDNKAPLIFINQKDSNAGKLFTLVHELVHVFIGSEEVYGENINTGSFTFSRKEAFANKVAAEVLVPDDEMQNVRPLDIAMVAKKFGVSQYVIARKLLDTNKINDKEYQSIVSDLDSSYSSNSKSKSAEKKGGNYNNNIKFRFDNRFINYVEIALSQNRISYTEALSVVGVRYKGYKILVGQN